MRFRCLLIILAIAGVPGVSWSQVLDVGRLNTRQIAALDRTHTVVLLVGGILEEHGPYLPIQSDAYQSEFVASRIEAAVVAMPGWTVLRFPSIPLGAFGANEIGGHFAFPGTFTVRSDTLRAVFMDLVDGIGASGFKMVVLVNLHGGPTHNAALDAATKYFNETYAGRMLHVSGLAAVQGAVPRDIFTSAQRTEEGVSPHADGDEHSRVLFLRPDAVAADWKTAPPLVARSMDDVVAIARRGDWPGYFGTPGIGNASAGSRGMNAIAQSAVDAVRRLLGGEDLDQLPRAADQAAGNAAFKRLSDASLDHERQMEEKQRAWLAAHKR
jgi:creatinine amidohydrolase/Fe(II)-dependent formamide hydrolase-like protein